MDSYILCGMQAGDEGKGSFIDYLAHKKNIDCIVRYNGGSQASHTVITPDGILHKFSQLGSGMFLEKCHTYITENMVINLDNLMVELKVFSQKTNIPLPNLIRRIHIHENCFVVTPYHKLINKLRELSEGSQRRGSVGTGVSEVMYLVKNSPSLGLRVKDIFSSNTSASLVSCLYELQKYVENFYASNKEEIEKNTPASLKNNLQNEIEFLMEQTSFLRIAYIFIRNIKNAPIPINLKSCIFSSYEFSYQSECSNAIFEGAQGLLIDDVYGIKPNTTHLDTTINFSLGISNPQGKITKIGVAKAFSSRHGLGVFPTEDFEINQKISDNNQEESFWNGKIRFGWFDTVLIKYAQMINKVDTLYLSSLDKLDYFEKIKICVAYVYTGIIDIKFREIFEYTLKPSGLIFITSIKKADTALGMYLKQCCPFYICINGWMSDISKLTNSSELPEECLNYIHLLENYSNIPISVVSVGPTRENKITLT